MSILCLLERERDPSISTAAWLAERLRMPIHPLHASPDVVPKLRQLPVLAERFGASLIVLPAPREVLLPWFDQVVELLRAARVPVLVARDASAFAGWARRTRTLRAVAEFDFTPAAERVVRWVERIAMGGPVELVAVHEYESVRAAASASGLQTSARDPSSSLERELRMRVGALQGELSLRVRLAPTSGPRGRSLVMEEGADLLALASDVRERIHTGRLCDAMLARPCNVLCVPVAESKLLS